MKQYNFAIPLECNSRSGNEIQRYKILTVTGREFVFRGLLCQGVFITQHNAFCSELQQSLIEESEAQLARELSDEERTHPTFTITSSHHSDRYLVLEKAINVRLIIDLNVDGVIQKVRLSVIHGTWGINKGRIFHRSKPNGLTLNAKGALYAWHVNSAEPVRRADNGMGRLPVLEFLNSLLHNPPQPGDPERMHPDRVRGLLKQFTEAALELRGFSAHDFREVWARFEEEQNPRNLLAMLRQPALSQLGLTDLTLPRKVGARLATVRGARETLSVLIGDGYTKAFKATLRTSSVPLSLTHALRDILSPFEIERILSKSPPKKSQSNLHDLAQLKDLRVLYPSDRAFANMLIQTLKECVHFVNLKETITDVFRMLEQLARPVPPGDTSLFSYHDALSVALQRQAVELHEFSYLDEVRERFERQVGDLAFRLPRTNWELFEVGRQMRHCVGSYAPQIISGRSLIVVGRGADGKAVACVEIAPQKQQVVQYKLNHNQRPFGEALEVAYTYCQHAKLKPGTSDLPARETQTQRLPLLSAA